MSSVQRFAHRLAPGLYRMDQVISISGIQDGFDFQNRYWTFGLIRLIRGELEFQVGGELIQAPGREFAMAMPPGSAVQVRLSNAKTVNVALLSQGPAPSGFPTTPIAFECSASQLPTTSKEVSKLLRSRKGEIEISRSLHPHVLSRRLKESIESDFGAELSSATME